MKKKIQSHLYIVAAISILLTMILSLIFFYSTLMRQVKVDLANTASVLAKIEEQEIINNSLIPEQLRLTLIEQQGYVLYDSAVESGEMANHIDREEVYEVLEEGVGFATRNSDTLGKNTVYYAIKNKNGNLLRLSRETDSIWRVFTSTLPAVFIVAILVFLIILWLSSRLTRRVIKPIQRAAENLDNSYQNPYEELTPIFNALRESNSEKETRILELKHQSQQIETILENMRDGLLVVDSDQQVLLVNSSAKQFLKSPTDSVIGKNYKYLSRRKELEHCIEKALDGSDETLEIQQNGHWFRFVCHPVYKNEQLNAALCFIFDITSEKESELIRQEFSANVTHELKTPLTTIRGYAELLENDMVKEQDKKRFAQAISRESIRLLSIITDILEISKLESSYSPIYNEICNLEDIVLSIKKELSIQADKKDIKITTDINPNCDFSILGNAEQLYQLVRNLVDNAIRYNRPSGTVNITLDCNEKNIILRVIDTGFGIPKENLSRIFERFYTVDKSRSKSYGGTGLGLSIVKHIAENHNAKINISSELDNGTEFEIIFTKPN